METYAVTTRYEVDEVSFLRLRKATRPATTSSSLATKVRDCDQLFISVYNTVIATVKLKTVLEQ